MELIADRQVDHTLWLGVSAGARRDFDPMDQRKPRGVGAMPSLSFPRPEWDREYSTFASDIRGEVGDAESWEFVVDVPSRNNALLRLQDMSRIPSHLAVALADLQHGRAVDLRASGGSYSFTPAAVRSPFALIIGNQEAVRDAISDVAPREFALGDNYPNPFNPTTTIPVSVPAAAHVTVKIYNLLGEELATLHDGTLPAGRHYFVWEGRNAGGQIMPTGMYLSRLTVAGGGSFTKKMLLVK
jgi:hypothetical protein